MLRKVFLATSLIYGSLGYTDVKCENCWYEIHENKWEIETYKFPDYEAAFWTCCYQCWGQPGQLTPSYLRRLDQSPAHLISADQTEDDTSNTIISETPTVATPATPTSTPAILVPTVRDPATDPRGNRIPRTRRAYGNYTYKDGNKRNGLYGSAPSYFEEPSRTCPFDYSRAFYTNNNIVSSSSSSTRNYNNGSNNRYSNGNGNTNGNTNSYNRYNSGYNYYRGY